MTGYSKKDALNKKPNFLQGKKTSEITKKNINENIEIGKPFKEKILNYRKDATPYVCEIHIFPLLNLEGKTTHFLALEKEVA